MRGVSSKSCFLVLQLNVLYLNAENHLQDCKDVDDSRMSDDDVVVDYKKHSRRRVRNVSAFVLLASAPILSCHITLVTVAESNLDRGRECGSLCCCGPNGVGDNKHRLD